MMLSGLWRNERQETMGLLLVRLYNFRLSMGFKGIDLLGAHVYVYFLYMQPTALSSI